MIQKHFGFTDIPFARSAPPQKLLQTERLTRAVGRLRYVVQKRSIGILAGPAGSGKTTVVRVLAADLADHRCRFHYILQGSNSSADLIRAIAWELGIEAFRACVVARKLKAELTQRLRIESSLSMPLSSW